MTDHTIDQARADWLADRRKGIGGSDVAAALGLDPYKSPVQLWQEKVGAADDSLPNNPAAIRRGNFLEDAVADLYSQKIQVKSIEKQVRHEVEGWRRGTQDLRVIDNGGSRRVVEIKTVARSVWRRDWGAPWSDEIPDRALCQGLWYANLDEAAIVDFAVVVIPDNPDQVIGCTAEEVVSVSDFHIYQATRRPDLEADLIAMMREWWQNHVVARVPPPPLSADDVDLLWSSHIAGETKQVDDELLALVREYDEVSTKARELYDRRDKLRDRLMIAAGPAEALVAPDGITPLVTMKTQERKAYEVKASSSRVVRMTKWWKRYLENNPTPQPKETP